MPFEKTPLLEKRISHPFEFKNFPEIQMKLRVLDAHDREFDPRAHLLWKSSHSYWIIILLPEKKFPRWWGEARTS